MPVIPTTIQVETRKPMVQGQSEQKDNENPSKKKKRLIGKFVIFV
jgi:hypothetical protein